MKNLSFFKFAGTLATAALLFTSCAGNNSEGGNGDEPSNGDSKLTLSVDKAAIEANGKDFAVFTVKDANDKDVTSVTFTYIDNLTSDMTLGREGKFYPIANGVYEFQAERKGVKSNKVTVTVSGRESVETFYRKIAVFKLTSIYCGACPNMTAGLENAEKAIPNRMVKLAFHTDGLGGNAFSLPITNELENRFNVIGWPTTIYNLGLVSMEYNPEVIKGNLQSLLYGTFATSGIKATSTYDEATGEVSVSATLKSSTGGEYDLAFAVVEDDLVAAGAYEEEYDHTVCAVSNNTYKFGATKFTVAADGEKELSWSKNINTLVANPNVARVVVYSIIEKNGGYNVDNIIELPLNSSVDYVLNN